MPLQTYRDQTFDRDGNLLDETVREVEVPDPPDYGNDAADLEAQAAQAITMLRNYLALQAPTNAQTLAALRLTIRVVLAMAKRMLA
jgi:hypothetical protein